MTRLRRALAPRDTCNGTCETPAGCTCLSTWHAEAEHIRTAELEIEAAIEAYRRGWRWGVLDGLVLGGALVAIAFTLGAGLWR